MKINNIGSIDEKKGNFLIVTDYRTDGLCVTGQYKTATEAIKAYGADYPQAILLLPDFNFNLTEPDGGKLS